MNRWVRKEFKTFNEEAQLSIQHWNDSWHKRVYKINHRRVRDNLEEYFSYHRIVEVVRVTTEQQRRLDFIEQIIVMRENDKPEGFSEADFKYLNKNDIEDISYFSTGNRKLPDQDQFNRSNVDISWFCDVALERFLKKVKLKIFETEFWKMASLLDEKVGVVREWKTNSTSDELPVIINH
ncbi:hypothetical protein Tco_1214330 [Tanacetum coccineum]